MILPVKKEVSSNLKKMLDRQVAKNPLTLNIYKLISKYNKNIVICTAHYDVLDWIKVDRLVDTTLKKAYSPQINQHVTHTFGNQKCIARFRGIFAIHYLIFYSVNSKCYIGFINKEPVAFVGIGKFPHPTNKNIYKVGRVVVTPLARL